MSLQEVTAFLSQFKVLFESPNEDLISNLYHLPCVLMDRTDFIPINTPQDILLFYQSINHEIAGDHQISAEFSIASLKELSNSLHKASVNWRLSYDDGRCLASMLVSYSLIRVKNTWKITVMEIENRPMPSCSNLNVKSKEHEYIKLSQKLKCVVGE